MNLIRKAFWPSAFALALFLFLGSIDGATPTSAASANANACRIDGPAVLNVGQTGLYVLRIQDNTEDVYDVYVDLPIEAPPIRLEDTWKAVINDHDGGDASITRATFGQDLPNWLGFSDFRSGVVNTINVESPNNISSDLLSYLQSKYGYVVQGNPCGPGAADVLNECILGDYAFDINGTLTTGCRNPAVGDAKGLVSATAAQRQAWIDAVDGAMAGGVSRCDDIGDIGDQALLDAGFDEELGRRQILIYWNDVVCDFWTPATLGPILDDVGFVEVTCEKQGPFTLSFTDDGLSDLSILNGPFPDAASINVVCRGGVGGASMSATPTPVEIVPAFASVSHALVSVSLFDSAGNVPAPGSEVTFITDRCSIESSGVDSEAEFESAEGVFTAYSQLNAQTAAAIENHDVAGLSPDSSRQQEVVDSIQVFSSSGAERVVAATVLYCDPESAPGVEPGPARITAYIDRGGADLDDYVLTVTVTVVGPPAGLAITATPAQVTCGEKVQVEVDVTDAAGQPVSDHTLAEIVTNYGGVLAGTGAVAGDWGNVTPLSSTVAETFGGKTFFYLLTSDTHEGTYDILVTSGGGGVVAGGQLSGYFTTAPTSLSVQVNCSGSVPVTEPTAVAPASGGTITPPNTGSAGLAQTYASWLPFIAVGLSAFFTAGVAMKRFARD